MGPGRMSKRGGGISSAAGGFNAPRPSKKTLWPGVGREGVYDLDGPAIRATIRFVRMGSQKTSTKQTYFHNERFARSPQTCDSQFLNAPKPIRKKNKGVQSGNPEMIRANEENHANRAI